MQLELIRFVASEKPLIAATKISERIIAIVKSPMPVQVCFRHLSSICT